MFPFCLCVADVGSVLKVVSITQETTEEVILEELQVFQVG